MSDGRGVLVVSVEYGHCERCSKACYIDCPITSARVRRDSRYSAEDARIGRIRTAIPDPSTPAASTSHLQ